MITRTRIAAIIIQNNKILLLKGKFPELWTPGGKLEENESDEECLKRELLEEIDVELVSMKPFKEYVGKSPYGDYITKQRVYIVSIKGKIKPKNEIKDFVWYTFDDFSNKKYPMISINNDLINDLIKSKIWKKP